MAAVRWIRRESAGKFPSNACVQDVKPSERILPTPKLTRADKQRSFYPYYAGFSEGFVAAMLDRLGVTERSSLLDPWNGSGTTTYLAAMRGASATGCDLNPALTVVARARAATVSDVTCANRAWKQVDRLQNAEDAPALDQCARLYEGLLTRTKAVGHELTPAAEALILCALFDILRKSYSHAKTRNPAWFSIKTAGSQPQPFADIKNAASASYAALVERQSTSAPLVRRPPKLHTCDFLALPADKASFDAVLTSPPYLTRLDYVKATLPELLLLARLHGVNIERLRSRMMGSPLVGTKAPPAAPHWGPTALEFLRHVEVHTSKASATYYLRFFLQYFDVLSRALAQMAGLLRCGGLACLVVQTSHYKELLIDLPMIVAQMSERTAFKVVDQLDFTWNRSIVSINSRAAKATKQTVESAIIVKRP